MFMDDFCNIYINLVCFFQRNLEVFSLLWCVSSSLIPTCEELILKKDPPPTFGRISLRQGMKKSFESMKSGRHRFDDPPKKASWFVESCEKVGEMGCVLKQVSIFCAWRGNGTSWENFRSRVAGKTKAHTTAGIHMWYWHWQHLLLSWGYAFEDGRNLVHKNKSLYIIHMNLKTTIYIQKK